MKILCVIVLYKQELKDSTSFKRIIKAVDHCANIGVFVYDNTPQQTIFEDNSDIDDFKYVSDVTNPGVSKAYNEGAKYAKEKGYDWILILDQDTDFQDNKYIEYCEPSVEEHPEEVLFVPRVYYGDNVILSPLPTRHHIAYQKELTTNEAHPLNHVSIINSGTLIRTDTFMEVGGYNEKVPLDFSDHQFFERLKKRVNHFFLMDYTLYQSFSNKVDDINSLKVRFRYFCKGARNYDSGAASKIDIFFVVIKRWISLTFRTKSLVFTKILVNNYIRK